MANGPCGFVIRWVFVIQSIENLSFAVGIEHNGSELPLICYTCVNVSDNHICNQYAVDIPCPKGDDFCYTLHIMDSTGASVVVNKKCANSSECWSSNVGCLKIDTQMICVSCCDEVYCNITVPMNQSDAKLSTRRVMKKNQTRIVINSGSPAVKDLDALFPLIIFLYFAAK